MVLEGFPIFKSVPGDVSWAVQPVEIRYPPPSGQSLRNRLHIAWIFGIEFWRMHWISIRIQRDGMLRQGRCGLFLAPFYQFELCLIIRIGAVALGIVRYKVDYLEH